MTEIAAERLDKLQKLANRLNLKFNDFNLLDKALTHSSYSYLDNERLEFFGDAILKLVVSEYLMERFPDFSEGDLTKILSVVVSNKILGKISKELGLLEYLLISKSARTSSLTLACSLEAIIAAVYLDSGLPFAKEFILKFVCSHTSEIIQDVSNSNFKGMLQEYAQSIYRESPVYKTVQGYGNDHSPIFLSTVSVKGKSLATGRGKSKKDSEQDSARIALERLKK